jgi:ArsR family transcriptional regulator
MLLRQQELSVAELQEILGMGQSRISTHLAQLRAAGIVTSRRSGRKTFYASTLPETGDGSADLIGQLLLKAASEIPEAGDDQLSLKLLLKRRRDTAREYFNQLAGRFGRSHCPGRSWEAFAQMLGALLQPSVVADLGAGEGTLSLFMARTAKKVIAVDNSEKMVAYGSSLAQEHGLDNIEFRLGEMEDPPIEAESVDLVIFSQALHHAENPQLTVSKGAELLMRGGRMVVLDLLAHQVEEARVSYADRWLGFSEVEMHRMLEEAGLTKIEVRVVYREPTKPHFETLFAIGTRE